MDYTGRMPARTGLLLRDGRVYSSRPPGLAQRLPANQRAPEREERLVDVGPLVIPDAEAAKLIQPGQRPRHDPPPPAQPAPVPGATHGEPRHDLPSPQSTPNRRRVVATIPKHTVRPLPRSPAFAAQRGNRIHQRQGFLRVIPVRAGETNRERHAAPVANQMTLAPALGSIGGIGTGLLSGVHRAHGATIDYCPRPINSPLARQPIEYGEVDEIPHTGQLPVAQASPARHPRTAAQFLRQHLPRDSAPEDKENAGETRTIRNARPSALWPMGWNRHERFDKIPQRIREQRDGHSRTEYRAASCRCSYRRSGGEVLLHVLMCSTARHCWRIPSGSRVTKAPGAYTGRS